MWGVLFFGSVPCELRFEGYRFRSSHRTIGQLCHALKELKTEVPTLDINEIGWYYQGRSSYISSYSSCDKPTGPIKEGPESETSFILCPTTGRKLNPNTLLPIKEHIDFNNRSVLC